MFVPIHKLRYLSCVRPFCGAEQSASYVFILYTYWRKISIQNSMGHLDRCGFLLFSHKICRIRTAHTANEMCMKFSCTISGCPAGARKWHISYFATLCIAKKEHHPDGWCFYLSGGFNSDIFVLEALHRNGFEFSIEFRMRLFQIFSDAIRTPVRIQHRHYSSSF